MDQVRQYILSVGAAGLMCAIVLRLASGGTTGKAVKFVSGLFMLLTLLQPLTGIRIDNITDYFDSYTQDAEEAVSFGKEQSALSVRNRIKEALASYILDKGAAHGAKLSVQVCLDDAYPPNILRIALQGDIAPFAKMSLQETLSRELGLEVEDIIWH